MFLHIQYEHIILYQEHICHINSKYSVFMIRKKSYSQWCNFFFYPRKKHVFPAFETDMLLIRLICSYRLCQNIVLFKYLLWLWFKYFHFFFFFFFNNIFFLHFFFFCIFYIRIYCLTICSDFYNTKNTFKKKKNRNVENSLNIQNHNHKLNQKLLTTKLQYDFCFFFFNLHCWLIFQTYYVYAPNICIYIYIHSHYVHQNIFIFLFSLYI